MTTKYEQRDTILHVENLSIEYEGRKIIGDISMHERDTVREGTATGQTIAVLGRSGRGKSTFFKALTGLEKSTTGRVLIPDFSKAAMDGKQPAKQVAEGDVGFVNQRYTLFRHKTVYSALMFALRNSKISINEKKDKIDHYLKEWGLEKCKDQYPNELSGGQRQRTAILEQLLSSGYYMVLDEPFSGLDIGNIMSVKNAFQLINASHELNTIIFSTHDIELAVELADSIYVMGYKTNENVSYGTFLKHFDLKECGLAWQQEFTSAHFELVKEIKSLMLAS